MSDEAIPADFLELCRDRLLRQRGDAEVLIDGERLLVAIEGQAERSVGVHNLWRSIEAYRDTPTSVTGAVDDWARTTVAPVETVEGPEALRASLRLVVRAPSFAAEMHQGGMEFPVADVVPGAATLLVSDTERAVRYLDVGSLEATELSIDEAFAHAADRLIEDFDDRLEVHTRPDGLRIYTCGGTYEASLMVLGPFWDGEDEEVGPLLVAIPARDLCLAAPKENPEAVAALEEAVLDSFDRDVPYLLVPHLYERKAGAWSLFGTVAKPTSPYGVRTCRLVEALAEIDGADVTMITRAAGLATFAVHPDGSPAPEAAQEDLDAALRDRMLAQRPDMATDGEGITTLRDAAGDALDIGLYSAVLDEVLEPDALVAFPSRDLVLAGSERNPGLLRARVEAEHAAAGERALTAQLFREVEGGSLVPWPPMLCPDCEAHVATTDTLCWRCHEAVWDGLLFRWLGESLAASVAVFGLLYGIGAATRWQTVLTVWFGVYVLGWLPRARFAGAGRVAAYGPWLTSGYRWMLVPVTLLLLWTYPGNVAVWVAGAADGLEAPELTAIAMWTAVTLGSVGVCLDLARLHGPRVLLPWASPRP